MLSRVATHFTRCDLAGVVLAGVVRVDLQGFQKARHHIVGTDRRSKLDDQTLAHQRLDPREDLRRDVNVFGHRVCVGKHGALRRIELLG